MKNTQSDSRPWYQRCYRRMLVDMHIPDWNPEFLAKYDPQAMADLYERAGLNSVMFYCQSHVGLCYWPTKLGKLHAGLAGRDVVGDMVRELRKRNIAVCGYYSVVYNNWAFLEHPEWRIRPAGAAGDGSFAQHRYGQCCPNNPGYRAFALGQAAELAGGYDMDGLFYDMTFWPAICVCDHCRQRFQAEAGLEIPETVNWLDPHWCSFQSARERWIGEFARDLSAQAKACRPGIAVYHNFACAIHGWSLGLSLATAEYNDFLGADFYGDATEQYMVSKLMRGLSTNQPIEFMTSRCVNLRDHVRLKPVELMRRQAFAATLFGSAMLFIDAINPDGTVQPPVYDWIRAINDQTTPFEPWLGGTPIAEIAVYFGSDSKMDFTDNGKGFNNIAVWNSAFPHLRAVRGVVGNLQRAHLPFDVVSARDLGRLSHYRLLILPNVLRLTPAELEAIRHYVFAGGRLYASRWTSLTLTDGTRFADFALADLFGCHFAADDVGTISYLKGADAAVTAAIAPQEALSQFQVGGHLANVTDASGGTLRLRPDHAGTVLASLLLPYASPAAGNVFDQNWASIHSSPPWQDTGTPVIVHHCAGQGEVIYSAADIESVASDAGTRVFLSLVRRLLGAEPCRIESDAHSCVWIEARDLPEQGGTVVGLLNVQEELPPLPVPEVTVRLRPPPGRRYTTLVELPAQRPVPFTTASDGTLTFTVRNLALFALVKAG